MQKLEPLRSSRGNKDLSSSTNKKTVFVCIFPIVDIILTSGGTRTLVVRPIKKLFFVCVFPANSGYNFDFRIENELRTAKGD